MRLVVIGVNHKTAPVALRERLAFVGDDVAIALGQLKVFTDGCVIVSTCNRTEIYALVPQDFGITSNALSLQNSKVINSRATSKLISSSPASIGVTAAAMTAHIEHIKTWLANFKQLPLAEIESYLYIHHLLYSSSLP